MRANPAGDWQIRGVEHLCREFGLSFRFGKGSHAHAHHPSAREILTIPARRPIKPVYIRKWCAILMPTETVDET
jgi:predicted RNA binding protein YcfA (HicA-like mRNA interferase family)